MGKKVIKLFDASLISYGPCIGFVKLIQCLIHKKKKKRVHFFLQDIREEDHPTYRVMWDYIHVCPGFHTQNQELI